MKKPSFVNLITTLSLILAGVVVGGSAGMFLSLIGAAASLYLIFSYKGFMDRAFPSKLRNLLRSDDDTPVDPIAQIGALSYLILILLTMIYYNLRITADQIIYIGVFGAALIGRTKKFLSDWLPFAVLIFAYEAMRGIADNMGMQVHFVELMHAERLLFFGHLPTIWLQEQFYTHGVTGIHDILALTFYTLHFTPAAIFGIYIWIKHNSLFKKYRDSMILVSYAALITFLLYPAAPPWMASDEGYIPHINRIMDEIDQGYIPTTFVTLCALASSNSVAAMPSLHAAYPWMAFLFAFIIWGKKGLPMILLPLGISLSAVYLGEHYIIDIIAGFIYATLTYLVVERLYSRKDISKDQPTSRSPTETHH